MQALKGCARMQQQSTHVVVLLQSEQSENRSMLSACQRDLGDSWSAMSVRTPGMVCTAAVRTSVLSDD